MHRETVRFRDLDGMGHVNNAVFSTYLEQARLAWFGEDEELPLWLPGEEYAGLLQADISRAIAAGLTFRPLEETARDTLEWSLEAGEQRPTLSREKERELLAGT